MDDFSIITLYINLHPSILCLHLKIKTTSCVTTRWIHNFVWTYLILRHLPVGSNIPQPLEVIKSRLVRGVEIKPIVIIFHSTALLVLSRALTIISTWTVAKLIGASVVCSCWTIWMCYVFITTLNLPRISIWSTLGRVAEVVTRLFCRTIKAIICCNILIILRWAIVS